ncbi:MAG: alanine racemase, partial [Gemmatimonadaceae bacterium]
FHSADRDDESMQIQEQRFDEAVAALPRRPRVLHAENSAALVRRQGSPWDIVRPGIFLYGAGTRRSAEIAPRPVVRLRARIVDMHTVPDGETVSYAASYRARGERRIATVALGYGDGYPRALGNRGAALIRGCRVPVAGVVNMDMVMLDITGTPCEVGDVATFIGADGDDTIGADDAARAADTIAYELFTRLSARLERVYSGGSA